MKNLNLKTVKMALIATLITLTTACATVSHEETMADGTTSITKASGFKAHRVVKKHIKERRSHRSTSATTYTQVKPKTQAELLAESCARLKAEGKKVDC